jgi:myosin heavy subunit
VTSFSIYHYAGKVTYSTKGFLEKNRDFLSNSIRNVLLTPEDDNLVLELFSGQLSPTGALSSEQSSGPVPNTAILTNLNFEHPQRAKPKVLSVPASSTAPNVPPLLIRRKSRFSHMTKRLSKARLSFRRQEKPEVKQGTAKAAPTVSTYFKCSLADLVNKMISATPQFIR